MPRPNPIPITYDPPADGAYPPRLLTPEGAIWVSSWSDIAILPGEVHVWNADGVCRIARLPTASNREILLNGAPLIVEHVLQDGDFYWDGEDRFIFQADPVADRKARLESILDRERSNAPRLSARLKDHLSVGQDGIRVMKARTFIRWKEVTRLHIRETWAFSSELEVWSRDDDQPVRSGGLRNGQMRQVLAWLEVDLPFDVSLTWGQRVLNNPYELAVQTKVLIPAAEGRRHLPADEALLLGRVPWSTRRKILAVVGGTILIAAFIFLFFTDPVALMRSTLKQLILILFLVSIPVIIRRVRSAFRLR